MANFVNPVPLGEAGTGAAYVLPESQSLKLYLNSFALKQHQDDQDAKLKQKQLSETNKSYDENKIKVLPGQLFGSEMNGLIQQHIDQGAKYRQQGFDIYHPDPSDPNQVKANSQYMQDRAKLEQMMEFRKSLEQNTYNKGIENLNDPLKSDKFEPDSADAFKSYFSENPDNNRLQNLFFGKEQAPSLQAGFNQTDFLKGVIAKPTTVTTNDGFNKHVVVAADLPNIQKQVESGLQSTPAAQRMLIKNGVDIGVLKGTKDKTQVMRELDAYYKTPAGQAELDKSEVPYGSDAYWKGLPQLAEARIESSVDNYHKIVDKMTATKAAEVENKDDSEKQYQGLNYSLALHNSARADRMSQLAQDKWEQQKAKGTVDSKVLNDPEFGTLKITVPNNKPNTAKGEKQTYNYSTYSTTWQPVKGEAVAIDVPNYKEIDLNGHLIESPKGNISRMRLMQVGNIPKLPSGSYANDATLNNLARQLKSYAVSHPDATRMSLSSGGSIIIPKDAAQIDAGYIGDQLSHESVAVLYNDQDLKSGKLATGAKPVLIPAKQIMSKIKANKLAVPGADPLNLNGSESETDDFGL